MNIVTNAAREARDFLVVEIEVKSVFGTIKCYPLNDAARLFAEIAGTRTLTRGTLSRCQSLGYEIVSLANADWRNVG